MHEIAIDEALLACAGFGGEVGTRRLGVAVALVVTELARFWRFWNGVPVGCGLVITGRGGAVAATRVRSLALGTTCLIAGLVRRSACLDPLFLGQASGLVLGLGGRSPLLALLLEVDRLLLGGLQGARVALLDLGAVQGLSPFGVSSCQRYARLGTVECFDVADSALGFLKHSVERRLERRALGFAGQKPDIVRGGEECRLGVPPGSFRFLFARVGACRWIRVDARG
ncbi:hypothetical protein N800_01650 [Lysobacter daejeonensis GH1-9]|uniref:Uncharacterized protein n=1 Tax=Lysobacter daejeonensis GH1-9 TaxID=1385517 RepID=A0A0A0EXL2_9GAMM|nr:hypothetical protein N800_01650 [Lysobacter daejeonensis GH1-9]